MREIVTVQVGQCGNQIGRSFWDIILQEHANQTSAGPVFTEPLSSFFRNVDVRTGRELPMGHGTLPISSLKAHAVLVDTEEGVVNETLAGPLGELFDTTEIVKGVSGAGNNFAHGFHGYGPQYRETVSDMVRRVVERCDAVQSFCLLHSLGGGTGSGMGTYILAMLEDEYPDVFRFCVSVFPSADDDVVTSPYNAAMAVHQLREHADCVLPIENQALIDICNRIHNMQGTPAMRQTATNSKTAARATASAAANVGGKGVDETPFHEMNNLAALLVSNLTSCSRFSGQLNVDLSELTTNLVPFPKVHFLLSGLSPLHTGGASAPTSQIKPLGNTLMRSFHRDHQLTKLNPMTGRHLACALLVRGNVELSDVNANIAKLIPTLNMVPWNTESFKIGLCSVPPVGLERSVLCLTNNCCVREMFAAMETRFDTLYARRKAYVHHYTDFMDEENFVEAREALRAIQSDYAALDRHDFEPQERFKPAI